jgi:glyoxylase-like metal-dependent hydrolase (beta-lactamase superfamily II)
MDLPLEDNVSDVIGKAQRGLGFSDADLAKKAGLEPSELEEVKGIKDVDLAKVEKLAQALRLGTKALVALAEGQYRPKVDEPKPGFFHSNTPYGDMTVNSYLIWDAESGEAAAFDSGADCTPLIEKLKEQRLVLKDVYLTHTHVDHVVELDRLLEQAGGQVTVHVNQYEKLDGAETFRPGASFTLGHLSIESRDTKGHSPGGTTFHVHGLDRPLAVVGDALFAGSMGGVRGDYEEALTLIRTNILSQQDGTVIAPGHGPLTTVGQEKKSNPFFALR